MTARQRQRGQPLLVFATILGGWAIMRVLLWTSPFPLPALEAGLPEALPGAIRPSVPGEGAFSTGSPAFLPRATRPASPEWLAPAVPGPGSLAADPAYDPLPPAWNLHAVSALDPQLGSQSGAPPVRRIASHYMLLASGMANMTLPPEIAAFYRERGTPAGSAQTLALADRPLLGRPAGQVATLPRASRWSADGWLMWREGSGADGVPGAAFYGRSQAGAVVRYRLAASARAPAAYLRANHTLEGAGERELAAGLSVRPLRGLPVRLAAEARVTQTPAGSEVRPAAFAVTELAPVLLPLGLRGEAYAQAGYVGGREATAFVDGQTRIDGRVFRLGEDRAELRAGVAAWGGAQKGAARLDIGPSATLGFRLGEAQSRVAVDYRFRVAGSAEPKSGPAVTFSAGF